MCTKRTEGGGMMGDTNGERRVRAALLRDTGQITFVFYRHIHARAACGESDACPCGAEYRGCGTRKTG